MREASRTQRFRLPRVPSSSLAASVLLISNSMHFGGELARIIARRRVISIRYSYWGLEASLYAQVQRAKVRSPCHTARATPGEQPQRAIDAIPHASLRLHRRLSPPTSIWPTAVNRVAERYQAETRRVVRVDVMLATRGHAERSGSERFDFSFDTRARWRRRGCSLTQTGACERCVRRRSNRVQGARSTARRQCADLGSRTWQRTTNSRSVARAGST